MKHDYQIIIQTEEGQTKATIHQNRDCLGVWYTHPDIENDVFAFSDWLSDLMVKIMNEECDADAIQEYMEK